MKLNDSERQLILTSLELKRENLLADLQEIEQLIYKAKNNDVIDNSVIINNNNAKRRKRNPNAKNTTWLKINEILLDSENPMTSRDILKELYKEYPNDLEQAEDRKNIAIISSILSEKVNDGLIIKINTDREQTKFKLNKLDEELDAFAKRMGVT